VTLLLYDDFCLRHLADVPHVERPERLQAIVERLRAEGLWDRCGHPPPREAAVEDLSLVHTPAYIEEVRRICEEEGGGALDLDTPLSRDSYAAARRAVGLALEGADRIADGRARNGFAVVRPPGHHALPDRGMGFCVFNNVAIAARHLQRRCGFERILISDCDIHHGNGTQAVFYEDPSVLYLSVHASPFYPGTGDETERGSGQGRGTIHNRPLRADASPQDVVGAMTDLLAGPGKDFEPDFVLLSIGFDAAAGDPIGVFALSPEHFAEITRAAMDLAEQSCGGRLLSLLEGGYNLDRLAACAAAHVRALIGEAT